MTQREQELQDSLLEVEWKSRRRPTRETLAEINRIARAAVEAALVHETVPPVTRATTRLEAAVVR